MGWKLNPELEAKCLAMADQRPAAALEVAPTFADEQAFMAAVIQQARTWGWDNIYHTYDSRRSEKGFPDLILLRRNRMLVVECKRSRKEKPTKAQQKWLRGFQQIPGCHVYIWSPEDWDFILKELS